MRDVCPFGDPGCPCPDGDACHYVDLPGSPGWKHSTAFYFTDLATLIRTGGYPVPSTYVATILAALDLAPVALAAIAYVETKPGTAASWDAWEACQRAIEAWRQRDAS